jgi:hypothetical protein
MVDAKENTNADTKTSRVTIINRAESRDQKQPQSNLTSRPTRSQPASDGKVIPPESPSQEETEPTPPPKNNSPILSHNSFRKKPFRSPSPLRCDKPDCDTKDPQTRRNRHMNG